METGGFDGQIREADISHLSFAVEIVEEFYGRVKGQDAAFQPAKLVWLIQRDFLHRFRSFSIFLVKYFHIKLLKIGDKNIDQVNQIRDSLAIMGDNSTAFSLPQPHLQRTKLCDMNDSELEPKYVERREQLKELVATVIRPKIVQGKLLAKRSSLPFWSSMIMSIIAGLIMVILNCIL
ncbi:uncharacterized protein A4U43_C07F17500 [Asparagus officinalis]|uniref:Uncharacterized protein n=1 Tax=Asparagus officinalis TaxID=4686 RepID=A0A5P1ECW2_ASPOF|nr:uncharacterized protein A4U43_C07F17500 [Asparagus officinalis]